MSKENKTLCKHRRAWPDFETWELVCDDCGKRREMSEDEGNKIFNRMTGLDSMGDWQ